MQIYTNGGADMFDAMCGGYPSQSGLHQLRQYYQQTMQSLDNGFRQFVEQSHDAYRAIDESHAMQLLRNVSSKVRDIWAAGVRPLESLEEFQTADKYSQRWVMANPVIRELYVNEECEGYAGSYENIQGDAIGRAQHDWRRVMTGVLTIPEEGVPYREFYIDTAAFDDVVLSTSAQFDILSNWDRLEKIVELGEEDPTSPTGALL